MPYTILIAYLLVTVGALEISNSIGYTLHLITRVTILISPFLKSFLQYALGYSHVL